MWIVGRFVNWRKHENKHPRARKSSLVRSVHHGESTIGPGEGRNQTPSRHTLGVSHFSRWLAALVENLPGQRTTLFPAHPFGPGEQRFAPRIANHGRILAALRLTR